ncbi:MAG TPA: peptidyl-alpha-hydroxyglycine alpha-amidating lyase family protein [Acidobacteriota bacterium]|jgi:DNA-binding beta-propeller fold protein YncE
MKRLAIFTIILFSIFGFAQPQKSKAPEQGYVPDGWYPHEGGLLKYRVAIRFGEEPDTMPDGWKFGRVSAVTTDSKGDVYVFHRGKKADSVVVFDPKGNYLRSWGRGFFGNPHGLRADKYDNIWAIDNGNHQVYRFTREGKLLQTWGIKGQTGTDDKTFDKPTDIAFAANGDFYISDGYGNSRVVKFNREGKYLLSWGKRGTGPGEFHTVHSVGLDSKGRVYVSDRENNRIQIFSPKGEFLKQWTHLGATQDLFITPGDEMWVVTHRNNVENITYDTLAGRLMKIDLESGRILGAMECPGHKITVTPSGEIFVASLTGNVFRWYPAWLTPVAAAGEEQKQPTPKQ